MFGCANIRNLILFVGVLEAEIFIDFIVVILETPLLRSMHAIPFVSLLSLLSLLLLLLIVIFSFVISELFIHLYLY